MTRRIRHFAALLLCGAIAALSSGCARELHNLRRINIAQEQRIEKQQRDYAELIDRYYELKDQKDREILALSERIDEQSFRGKMTDAPASERERLLNSRIEEMKRQLEIERQNMARDNQLRENQLAALKAENNELRALIARSGGVAPAPAPATMPVRTAVAPTPGAPAAPAVAPGAAAMATPTPAASLRLPTTAPTPAPALATPAPTPYAPPQAAPGAVATPTPKPFATPLPTRPPLPPPPLAPPPPAATPAPPYEPAGDNIVRLGPDGYMSSAPSGPAPDFGYPSAPTPPPTPTPYPETTPAALSTPAPAPAASAGDAKPAVGGGAKPSLSNVEKRLREVLSEPLQKEQVLLEKNGDELRVTIWSRLVFQDGAADTEVSESRIGAALKAVGNAIGMEKAGQVKVEAHSGSGGSLNLTQAQAANVAKFLKSKTMLNDADVNASDQGDKAPLYPRSSTEAVLGRNDRIVITLR